MKMRFLKIMLPLLALLIGGVAATADYNPADPPEPGVNFTLSLRSVPADGAYWLSGAGTYPFGSGVYVSVAGNHGYRFEGWEEEDGTLVSTDPSFTYTMPVRDVTLTARFTYDPGNPVEPDVPEFKNVSHIKFVVNPADAGSFSSYYEGDYEVGATYSFHTYPYSNYRFVNWTRNGVEVGTDQYLEYTVPYSDHTLVANFAYDPNDPNEPGGERFYRRLTLESDPADGASVYYYGGDSNGVKEGDHVGVYADPRPYYTFVNWTDGDGNVVSDSSQLDYAMPDHDVTLTAHLTYDYNPADPGEPGGETPSGSIGENMVWWPRFGMYDDTHVQILCETPGSEIHYTLDGTDPTKSSPVYNEPVYVSSNLLVKAIAYVDGMEDSPVVSYRVSAYKTGIPVFTFEDFKIKITSATPGATIRYTLDFTNPTVESDVYTEPFTPEENCRIKAYASKEGLTDSPVSIYVYRRAEHVIPAPKFAVNDDHRLVIIPGLPDATTHYTLDGSDPDETSAVYTEPLALEHDCTVKAYSTRANYFDSPMAEYTFIIPRTSAPSISIENDVVTIMKGDEESSLWYAVNDSVPANMVEYTAPFEMKVNGTVYAQARKDGFLPSDVVSMTIDHHKVAAPAITFDDLKITITQSDEEGVSTYYTLDGSEPTEECILYEAPFGLDSDATVRARSFKQGWHPSDIVEFAYVTETYTLAAPVIDVDGATVTLSASDPEASVWYALDDSDPEHMAEYTGPFTLDGNCVIYAQARRDGWHPSEVVSVAVDGFKVSAPRISCEDLRIVITQSDEEGVSTHYTIDGSEPTEESALYEAPFALDSDATVRARSFKQGWHPSEVVEFAYVAETYTLAAPVINVDGATVTLSASDPEAALWYSLEDSAPEHMAEYTGPFTLDGNCVIYAQARRDGWHPSEVVSMAVDGFKVSAPRISCEDLRIVITQSDEEGVSTHYTIDGSEPTEESALYEAPFGLASDATVRARSFKQGWRPSDIVEFAYVAETYTLAAPVIDVDGATVTQSAPDPEASVWYALDDSEPEHMAEYTAPFTLNSNCVIYAQARRDGWHPSEVVSVAVDGFKVSAPRITCEDLRIVITQSDEEGVSTYYTLDGSEPTEESTLYEAPFGLAFDATVLARSFKQGWHPSDIVEFSYSVQTYTVPSPVMTYDGHNMTIECEDPLADVFYSVDGGEWIAYAGAFDAMGLHDFSALASRDGFRDSSEIHFFTEYYSDLEHAETSAGGQLGQAFQWMDSGHLASFSDYAVVGPLNGEDYSHVRRLTCVKDLDLSSATSDTVPGLAFKGLDLVTVRLPRFVKEYGAGMLEGNHGLCAVFVSDETPLTEGAFGDVANPNLLVYASEEYLAANGASSEVPWLRNVISANGYSWRIGSLALADGSSFFCPEEFEAGEVEFVKSFSKPTALGGCQGWESICLPFDIDMVSGAGRTLVPFAAYDGDEDARPFWLYKPNGAGWERTAGLEAYRPYLISMPNCQAYDPSYNITGDVTFHGGFQTIPVTPEPEGFAWKNGADIWPNFSRIPMEAGLFVVNDYEYDGLLGNVFRGGEHDVRPFECYVTSASAKKALAIFDQSGVDAIEDFQLSVRVDGHDIVVTSPYSVALRVFDLSGQLVRVMKVTEGVEARVGGLTPGVYFIADRKLLVK